MGMNNATKSVARIGNVSRPVIIGWVVVDKANAKAHVGEPYPAGHAGERAAQDEMRRLNQGGLHNRYAVDAVLA